MAVHNQSQSTPSAEYLLDFEILKGCRLARGPYVSERPRAGQNDDHGPGVRSLRQVGRRTKITETSKPEQRAFVAWDLPRVDYVCLCVDGIQVN